MSTLNFFQPAVHLRCPPWMRAPVLGYVYWLTFLLVLEPGNVFRAIQSGYALAVSHEMVRIGVAALLGATLTPILVTLTRRFPVVGRERWRHLLIHIACAAGLALGLVLISCVLAAWLFERAWLPSLTEVQGQVLNNWLLLIYALGAFIAIVHTVHFDKAGDGPPPVTTAPTHLTRVAIKTRRRESFLAIGEIDWIEAQGNYLALHVGADTHLIRETLVKFEAQLEASRFVRIHRGVIVAIDRIKGIKPAANGDAIVHLKENRELRVSRGYRDALRAKWPGVESPVLREASGISSGAVHDAATWPP